MVYDLGKHSGDGMSEQWRPIVGLEGSYEVSDLGRIRSIARIVVRRDGLRLRIRERIRKVHPHPIHGYLTFTANRAIGAKYVHVIVMRAFVGPCPLGLETRHRDGDQLNNKLSNLTYGTKAENESDKITHGTLRWGERVNTSKLKASEVIQIRMIGGSKPHREIASEFGVSRRLIGMIISRKIWANLAEAA